MGNTCKFCTDLELKSFDPLLLKALPKEALATLVAHVDADFAQSNVVESDVVA